MKAMTIRSDEDVARLVHGFYGRIRADDLLGPVFTAHIHDWPMHLGKMVDFWSSILHGTARYRGSPMLAHNRLPDIQEAHFQRWLALFHETTQSLNNPDLRAQANATAERIAQSLWYGYQLQQTQADHLPQSLGKLDGGGA